MKLVVVSICHNEAETIGQVLDAIPKKIDGITSISKLVIDDGSDDGTARIAEAHGAVVLSDGAQKRLAFRFREAVDAALSHGADIMVNIDGDLQFDPADIPELVEPIVTGRADFVAADRFSDASTGKYRRPANMPLGKYLGNRMGARIVSRMSRHEFHDVTCGFRAYNRNALFALNTDGTYTYTQESFQVLAMKRMRIMAMPVPVTYFEGRKSRVVKSIFKFIAIGAISILRSYRDFAPIRFFGWLGFYPFFLGLVCFLIFLGHWLSTGHFSPYKFLGFAGIYFLTLALFIWALGLVADMFSRMLNNQEKIIERLKRIEYKEDPKETDVI